MRRFSVLIAPALLAVVSPALAAPGGAEPVRVSLDRAALSAADPEARLRHIDARVRRVCGEGARTAEERRFERLCRAQLTAEIVDGLGDAAVVELAQRRTLTATAMKRRA